MLWLSYKYFLHLMWDISYDTFVRSQLIIHLKRLAVSFMLQYLVFSLVGSNINKTFFFPPQQDVSEFTHKLLDWLEDAFQMKAEEET